MSDVKSDSTVGSVLLEKVYLPAFMKQAESRGLTPGSIDQLEDMLKIATMIRLQEATEVERQASATGVTLNKAASALADVVLGKQSAQAKPDTSEIAKDQEVRSALSTVVV
jgi:hypothetical protein